MTIELTTRQELIGMFSDSYKDAYGIRPRGYNYDSYTNEELEFMIDSHFKTANENYEEEKIVEAQKVIEFKAMIQRYINEFGATNEDEALKWYLDGLNETFYSSQCVEQVIWREGIIFTDYGKEIALKLARIATYVK